MSFKTLAEIKVQPPEKEPRCQRCNKGISEDDFEKNDGLCDKCVKWYEENNEDNEYLNFANKLLGDFCAINLIGNGGK